MANALLNASLKDIGYIYCITNPSMPGVVKIGMTRRMPEERLADANRDTWNHTKFQLAFAKKVEDPEQKERAIHKILEQHGQRKSSSREFFTISVELTKMYFDLIPGEDWNNVVVCNKKLQVQPNSIPKKKERTSRKKDTIAQVSQVQEPGTVKESIDLFALLSQNAHDINGWPPVQHLNSYESYLLLSTAFDKKLLRLLIHGTPYQFDELNQIDATDLRGCAFELIDNKGYLVTSARIDELFDRMQQREYVTLCTGTGQWRTVGDLGDAPRPLDPSLL